MNDPYFQQIDAGWPFRLRGTNQQTQNGLLWTPPSALMGTGGQTPNTATLLIEGVGINYASLHNRSGGTAFTGIGARVPNRYWIAGQWTNASSTYTDDTADAQSTATADFPLETTTTNDGYIIAAPFKFNAISLNVGTASVGAAPVRAVRYSNGATSGSAWTNMGTNLFVQDAVSGQYATGEQLVVFGAPADWLPVSSLNAITGLTSGLYALNVRATTAPTVTAGVATCLEVWRLYLSTEAVADNGTFEYAPNRGELRFPESDGVACLFSTLDLGNRATVTLRTI